MIGTLIAFLTPVAPIYGHGNGDRCGSSAVAPTCPAPSADYGETP